MRPDSLFSRLNPPVTPAPVRRGFSLVELLIVIAIIAVLIALIVPALSGTRNSARKVVSDKLVKEISNAASVFARDNNGRMPGYFTVREMARTENLARGMSMTENVMLDLMGFQTGGNNPVQIGPTTANTLSIDPTLLGVPGVDGKQYYVPDKKFFIAQVAGVGQMGALPHAGAEGDPAQLPDVVDAFGQPLLIWVEDDTYISKPNPSNPTSYTFARADSGANANAPGSKHYWATNACFLTAQQLGKKGTNQQTESMIGCVPPNPPATVVNSLEGFLGNPNAAWRPPSNLNDLPSFRPLASRAPFVVQSAGVDGTYFGRRDKGAKQFAAGFIDYRVNFAPDATLPISATNQYLDRNGKPTNADILNDFDDLFAVGGN